MVREGSEREERGEEKGREKEARALLWRIRTRFILQPSVLGLLPQASPTSGWKAMRNLLCTAYSPLHLLYMLVECSRREVEGGGGRKAGWAWEDIRVGP